MEGVTLTDPTITFDEFRALLPRICGRETAFDRKGWTPENPLYAHCAVVSLLVQDIFGGVLLCASLEPFPEFAHMRSHYWNRLPDGTEIDLTEPQFFGRRPRLMGEPKKRARLLSSSTSGITMRYKVLASRLASIRSGRNASIK